MRTAGASDSHSEKWTSVEARGKRAKYHPISNCFQPAKSFSKLRFSGCTFKKDTTKSFIVSTPTEHRRSTARQSAGGVAYGGTTRGTERSRCKMQTQTPYRSLSGRTNLCSHVSFLCSRVCNTHQEEALPNLLLI